MHLPNYKNGSIVNLMASLARELGGGSPYGSLKGFDMASFHGKNIILMVIDGLGYEFLKRYGRGSFLEKNLTQKITSVFPSTTAAGVTAFLTGTPAQQHGLTGWFMYLKELGLVARIIPFTTRAGRISLEGKDIKFSKIFQEKSFFKKIKAAGYAIHCQDYFNSPYSSALTRGAKKLPFNLMSGFFKSLEKALREPGKKKFIYAYWDGVDSVCHKFGCTSLKAVKHFRTLDKKIAALAKTVKNTVLIITADHGLIDTEPAKLIKLADHPELARTLALPLCGEPRLVYCYVKPGQAARFKKYVKTHFKQACEVYDSQKLIKRNFFGLFKANPNLSDRVGDYTLIMKDNYIIKDFLEGEDREFGPGVHGGVSKEEMFVPLVVVDNN